jgi:hypothetical protein
MSRVLPWIVAALGAVLLVVGVVLFVVANSTEVGWAAYGSPPVFSDGMFLWTRQHTAGLSIAVLGLVVLVGLGGWLLGRRSSAGPV